MRFVNGKVCEVVIGERQRNELGQLGKSCGSADRLLFVK